MTPTLPYAYPNATDLLGIFTYANTITENLFGTVIMFTIWVLLFLAMGNQPPQKSLTAASFITVIVGALFWAAGIIGAAPMIAAILALIASALYLFIYPPRGY